MVLTALLDCFNDNHQFKDGILIQVSKEKKSIIHCFLERQKNNSDLAQAYKRSPVTRKSGYEKYIPNFTLIGTNYLVWLEDNYTIFAFMYNQ